MRKMTYQPGRAAWMLAGLVLSFTVLRIWLHLSPEADFDVGGYNIHHLFTGLLILTACGIPLALFTDGGRLLDVAAGGFGTGLGMALDEWVYLIATDGSNASYLLPVSFWGGAVMVGLACLYTVLLIWLRQRSP
jgi:hypothetical protein